MNKDRILKLLEGFNSRERRIVEENWQTDNPEVVNDWLGQIYYLRANCRLNLEPDQKTTEIKKMYFKAARSSQLAWWFNMNLLVSLGHKTNISSNTTSAHIFMDYPKFLLSGNAELVKVHYAHVSKVVSDKRKNDGTSIIYAFLNLINGNFDEAKKRVENIELKVEAGIKPFAMMVKGILVNDLELCNSAISLNNKIRKKFGNVYDYHPTSTALAKLGLDFQMNVDITSPEINKRMLEFQEIEFEDIDNYFEMLGIEPLNRVSLKNF